MLETKLSNEMKSGILMITAGGFEAIGALLTITVSKTKSLYDDKTLPKWALTNKEEIPFNALTIMIVFNKSTVWDHYN